MKRPLPERCAATSRRLRRCAAALLGLAWLAAAPPSAVAAESSEPAVVAVVRVVYHLDGGLEQASSALRSIRNHLRADPAARITVVALGAGVDFLLEGAEDAGGYPYELVVADLVEQGVTFAVCANTLEARGIERARLVEGVAVVPSGVAEIARLQAQQGYAYLKP